VLRLPLLNESGNLIPLLQKVNFLILGTSRRMQYISSLTASHLCYTPQQYDWSNDAFLRCLTHNATITVDSPKPHDTSTCLKSISTARLTNMAKTTLKISHPHMAVPKKQQNKSSPPQIAAYPSTPTTPQTIPSFQDFVRRAAPVPIPEPEMPYSELHMTPLAPLPTAIQRKPVKPRPSSSVYISRTSQIFEPVISGYSADGKRAPSTEFYWKPAKYDDGMTALPEFSPQASQDVTKAARLSNRYLDEEKNVRESVLLLASIMPRDDDEESASSVYGQDEVATHRPVTYLPALEQVYHRALNHEEPSPEEDVFPENARRKSQNKAHGILGLDVYRSHTPEPSSYDTLPSTARKPATASAWSTPSLSTSNRASYKSASTTDDSTYDPAQGYHDLLSEVYHSEKQPVQQIATEDNVSTTLRLVPAPLFSHSKQKRDVNARKMPYTPVSAPALLQSRPESTDCDRFHVALFRQQPERPVLSPKVHSPRLPFIHENKTSSSTSLFSSSTSNMTSIFGSALDKAKGSLATTLSSIAENLETSQEKSRTDRDDKRKSKLKNSIQVIGPCDANATIVAERLKSVPLGVISSS